MKWTGSYKKEAEGAVWSKLASKLERKKREYMTWRQITLKPVTSEIDTLCIFPCLFVCLFQWREQNWQRIRPPDKNTWQNDSLVATFSCAFRVCTEMNLSYSITESYPAANGSSERVPVGAEAPAEGLTTYILPGLMLGALALYVLWQLWASRQDRRDQLLVCIIFN